MPRFRNLDPEHWIVLAYAVVILTFFAALCGSLLFAAPVEDNLQRILSSAGYSEIRSTGYRFIGCGDNDLFRQGFAAKGPTGQPVTGIVCSSPLKGHTIRLD